MASQVVKIDFFLKCANKTFKTYYFRTFCKSKTGELFPNQRNFKITIPKKFQVSKTFRVEA